MNSFDLLRMGLKNLFRRKTRTFLTVLGVVIGTFSIVIMLSLGYAMEKNFQRELSRMGSLNVINVFAGHRGPELNSRNPREVGLTKEAVATFEKIPGVEAVLPLKQAYMRVGVGKMVGEMPIVGVEPEKLSAFDFDIEEGRLLTAADKNAIIFGKRVAYNFRDPRIRNYGPPGDPETDPPPVNLLKDKLVLTSDLNYGERRQDKPASDYKPPRPHEVKGVGILKKGNYEKDYNAFMHISTLEKILEEDKKVMEQAEGNRRTKNNNTYDQIKVKVSSLEQVETIQKQIQAMGYQAHSLNDIVEDMNKTSRIIQAILGGIGAVSLLVAAIGITNTMIMSIYERTREIGVIKVLGAELADIRRLFLLEASLIGFGGGLIGLILSCGVSCTLNLAGARFLAGMSDEPVQISIIAPELALGAILFATLIGLISGYAPARRAMKLSALEAIGNE